jgi:ABC-type uncharacterized transport system auxiliary subunit
MRRFVPVAIFAALAACGGSLFQTKAAPPTMYLLSAVPASVPVIPGPPPVATDLAVFRPRVRAGLDTDRIAALYPDRRLDFFADVRWSGPLDEVIQDLTIQKFRLTAGLGNVRTDASVFASAYWLEIQVIDFQAEYSGSATAPTIQVRLVARLGNSGDRRILVRIDAHAEQVAADNRMSAIVDAYNVAVNEALAEIVAGTAGALKAH